jgi:uncharacterized SAM-binding protein YcdF (DUF218 family)
MGAKIRATMIQVSSGGQPDSSGRREAIATDTLLGVLAAFVIAQLAPWGQYDLIGTIVSVLLGALGGLVVGRFFRRPILIAINVSLIVLYLVIAWTPVVVPFTSRWIRVDPLPSDTLDAIVVLSGGMLSDSSLSGNAADRLLTGLELIRAGRARRLITTRQSVETPRGRITSDSDQTRLISLASVADRWSMVIGAHTTRDEAVLTSQLLFPRGQKRIAVVTSPLHTRRACAVFEAVGFSVVCRASRERDNATNPPFGEHDRLAAFRSYGYELVGFVKYRMRGWLTPHPGVT